MTAQQAIGVDGVSGDDVPVEAQFWRETLERYVENWNARDLAGVIGMYHDESPMRELEKHRLAHVFSNSQGFSALLDVRLVSCEGQYALVSVRQKGTNPAAPPELQHCVSAKIMAFRRQHTEWRIWTVMLLEMAAA